MPIRTPPRLSRHGQVLGLWALALSACQPPAVTSAGGSGPGAGAQEGGAATPTGHAPSGFPDASTSGPARPIEGGEKCAAESHAAERVPVDLLLLIDRSGSMNATAAPGRTKWALARQALTTFLGDPKSEGLGVGMAFFPTGNDHCTTNADCGLPNAVIPVCVERQTCVGNGLVGGAGDCGAVLSSPCPAGTMCAPLGRCAMTGADCVGLGKECPGGPAGNLCTKQGKVCALGSGDSCQVPDYEKPVVAIAGLPAARGTLTGTLMMTSPGGGTPTDPAVEGAINILRMRAVAMPGRRGALVLVTDGIPDGCADDAAARVTAQLMMASRGMPAISTYVIGVFAASDAAAGGPAAMAQWAAAGGTGMPFVINPTDDLSGKLLDALNQIRGAAVACEYRIPPASMGGMIDFQKVNLHFTGTSGEEEVGYVGRADKCDPTRGGWYYDVDPDLATPTRVMVCPATCQRFKADASARVELQFGCKTRVIE